MGPWGMDPRAVNVAPGTEGTWTCDVGPAAIDAHTFRQKYVHSGTLLGVKSAGETHSGRTVLAKYAVRQYQHLVSAFDPLRRSI